MSEYLTNSPEETIQLGRKLGRELRPNSVVVLIGDLGSGKTTFIKGLVEGSTGLSPEVVNSPTFTYLNIYKGRKIVYHFDLYRLKESDEFVEMGFVDYLSDGQICCIEWGDKISKYLPKEAIFVYLAYSPQVGRKVVIKDAL